MDEIVVDRGEIVAVAQHVDQLLAHAHQRGRAARRQVKPAEQLLPARLGGSVHFRRGFVIRLRAPGGDRRFHARGIGAEALSQRLEEGNARAGGQLAIAAEDFARAGNAGGLAAARQEMLAQLDQALGARARIAAPVARQQARGRARKWSAEVLRRTRCSSRRPGSHLKAAI